MKHLDLSQLRALSAEAAAAPRLRKNYNLHASATDPIQRMLNAFEPGTYVRPHRHRDKWELFVILSGRAAVLAFDDDGRMRERVELNVIDGNRVVEIPPDTWHSFVSLAPQTVMFEVKAGPYAPTAVEDFCAWAPLEGTAAAPMCEHWFRTAQCGDILTP